MWWCPIIRYFSFKSRPLLGMHLQTHNQSFSQSSLLCTDSFGLPHLMGHFSSSEADCSTSVGLLLTNQQRGATKGSGELSEVDGISPIPTPLSLELRDHETQCLTCWTNTLKDTPFLWRNKVLTVHSDQSVLLSKHYISGIFYVILETLNQEKELGLFKVAWIMVT